MSRLPRRSIDLTEQKFGRLSVGAFSHHAGKNNYWTCQCDCGNTVIAATKTLRSGECRSCGCLHREIVTAGIRARSVTHGRSRTKEYRTWCHMRDRCYNENDKAYRNYGGRGIEVCKRWDDSFEAFFADMGPAPSPGHTLDRIDNNGPYSSDNCRWATKTEQSANTRHNHYIEHRGERLTLTQWERRLGLRPGLISQRIGHGMAPELALTMPVRQGHYRDRFLKSR